MPQPIRKTRKKEFKAKITGIQYCDECPFFGMDMNNNWICSPNDYVFGKHIDGKIPVPRWCGNQKQEITK